MLLEWVEQKRQDVEADEGGQRQEEKMEAVPVIAKSPSGLSGTVLAQRV